MKELLHEDWVKNTTPRLMYVWNDRKEKAEIQLVISYIYWNDYPVVAIDTDTSLVRPYKHSAD